MRRHEKSERNDAGGARRGFEVHVIGGGNSAPLAGETGDLEPGLRIGTGDTAPETPGPEDPVYRLETAEPVKARPMSEAGPAVPRTARKTRRGRRKWGLGQWTFWMAVATCLVVVAAVVALMATRQTQPAAEDTAGRSWGEREDPLDAESRLFLERSSGLAREAEDLLARFAAATTVAEVLPLVRDPDRVEDRLSRHWEPWDGTPAFSRGGTIHHRILQAGQRSYIVLSGHKGDYEPFEVVFVRIGEEMKIDWEASYGIGDVQLAELDEGMTVAGGEVRVVVRKGKFFTPEFPEDKFRSYRLLGANGEHFVWAFAPRGSTEEAALEAEFNENSILMDQVLEFRATLKLSGPVRPGTKLFQITEMLHKDWVTP